MNVFCFKENLQNIILVQPRARGAAMTLRIMTFGIMTLSIMTLSIMTFGTMTLSINEH
jgi:hypothetical protein